MSSESYKRFLKSQAKKNPIEIGRVRFVPPLKETKEFFLPLGRRTERRTHSSPSSDLLESVYLGKEPTETVVVDRGAARMLQERLAGLEAEIDRLHRRVRVMRMAIAGLLGIATVLALLILF